MEKEKGGWALEPGLKDGLGLEPWTFTRDVSSQDGTASLQPGDLFTLWGGTFSEKKGKGQILNVMFFLSALEVDPTFCIV